MAKKKVHHLLKGAAIAGAATTGASTLGDANLAFAQDMEAAEEAELVVPVQEVTLETATEVVQEVSEVAPGTGEGAAIGVDEQIVEVEAVAPPAEEEPEQVTGTMPVATEGKTLSAANVEEGTITENAPVENTVLGANIAKANLRGATLAGTNESVGEQEITETGVEVENTTELTIEEEEAALASTSESNQEVFNQKSESLSTAVYEAESSYASESTAYTAAGYESSALIDARADVDAKMTAEETTRSAIADNNQKLTSGNYYNVVGRPLAVAMIKFKLILTGQLDENTVSTFQAKWDNRGAYQDKNCKVTYTDVNGIEHTEFYDYVTIDEEGESYFKTVGANGRLTDYDDVAKNVTGINVLEKENINSNPNGQAKFNSKGQDWYKKEEYERDIAIWDALKESVASLAKSIDAMKVLQGEFDVSTSESLLASQNASESRADSLSERRESERVANSLLASTYESMSIAAEEARASASESTRVVESLSLSESVKIAESLSTSESTRISDSLSASDSTRIVASISAAESLSASAESEKMAASLSRSVAESSSIAAATSESAAVAKASADVAHAHISEAKVPLSVVHDDHGHVIENTADSEATTNTAQTAAQAENGNAGATVRQANQSRQGATEAGNRVTITNNSENMAMLHKADSETQDILTVSDEESAKFGQAKELSSTVGRHTLPVLGAIIAFFGFGKAKKEKENIQSKNDNQV